MTVYEVLTVALIVVLGTAATAAIYLGLLNWIGAAYVVRCAGCRHLTVSQDRRQPELDDQSRDHEVELRERDI